MIAKPSLEGVVVICMNKAQGSGLRAAMGGLDKETSVQEKQELNRAEE